MNGQPVQTIALTDRGLAYGDGLFETLQVQHGRILRLERHLARLTLGCQRLAIALDIEQVEAELLRFCAAIDSAVCKLIVTRGDGLRGYAPPESAVPRRILQLSPLPQWPSAHAEQGVQLYPCTTRLAYQPVLAGLKHLNRLEQVLARAEWQDPQYAEGLMLDYAGQVIEGVFSNVFFIRAGCVLTPDLSGSGVAGVMRECILELAQSLTLPVQVGAIHISELGAMDEVFVCNSLYGIWPVRRYAEHRWSIGPLTRTLQQHLNKA